MKITDLNVEGYGVWSGLKIERFSDNLNVLYGPNEAGKTTLLQFIRSMLYGFSSPRRKYLPPVHGGRPGGVLNVTGPHGGFEIARYDASTEGTFGEDITLTAPDGTRQGEHFLKVLLANVDEIVFNNVFAIGLREIQELATLSDTEAAEQLYNLSAGLDRVSLVEVLQELSKSRNRILDAAGKPCQLTQLFDEHEKLRTEIEELESVNRRWGHLVGERDQLHQEIIRLEEEANRTENAARTLDLALSLRDRWMQRASLDEQLVALGPQKVMPENAIERLDGLNARLQQREQRIAKLDRIKDEAKREYATLSVNEALWRQASRIEALKEQEPWIVQLQNQIREIEKEITDSEAELASEREQLGLGSEDGELPTFSMKTLASLRTPGKLLRQCREQWDNSQQAAAAARQMAEGLTKQIETALSARGEKDLTAALDRAGGLVSQLRRRHQIDERLEQLARYQAELEERSRQLVSRQMLPLGVVAGLGGVFVVGMTLVLVSLFLSQALLGSVIGWILAVVGLAGVGVTTGGKVLLERSNAQQLEGCQKQLGVLQMQVQQVKDDRDAIDSQLPHSSAPVASRLESAEQELAALEEISPLDTRRNAAKQDAETATRRTEEAKDNLKNAKRRWRDALSAAGLPEGFTMQQVRRLAQRGDRITEIVRRIEQRQEDLNRRDRELESLTTRVVQLAADAGTTLKASTPVEQLRELSEAAAKQQTQAARRDALRRQAKQIRSRRAKQEEKIVALKHRRRALFLEAGVKEEQEFRQRALECARYEVLQRDRDVLVREIQAAVASQCSEDVLRKHLEGPQNVPLESRREDLRQRLAAIQEQLRDRLENRGRLSEQLASLAADKQLGMKYLDLAVLEKRLEDAIRRWQVLAVTCCILDMIRTTYELHRQPETLQEASHYLDRLTQGRYHRVWTPLGEHALRVDDAEGHSLPAEVLSRGTREQLFLALRLALASSYARRGAPLPLVLDDVLVNFDADRAKAAAAVLRDFAAMGHQLLVFTCHEHIFRLFVSLKVPGSQLPNNSKPGKIVLAQRTEEPSKRSSQRKPAAKPKPREEEPEVDEDETDEVDSENAEEIQGDDELWDEEDDDTEAA
jgi:uncharacterized protein YhaN